MERLDLLHPINQLIALLRQGLGLLRCCQLRLCHIALRAQLVAKLLCQSTKLIAMVNLYMGMVDANIFVGAFSILELLGAVLILDVPLVGQVRPVVWLVRQALPKCP